MLGRLLQDIRLTALWHYLEFLPGVYPVTNALTLSIYYYIIAHRVTTGPSTNDYISPLVQSKQSGKHLHYFVYYF